jgi:hypothetical protein
MLFQAADLTVDPDGESHGHCDCCGHTTLRIWGYIAKADACLALHYVRWTIDHLEHDPLFQLVIGPWGEGTEPKDRFCVAFLYRLSVWSFMVIDAHENQLADGSIARIGLRRHEVIGTPLASQVSDLSGPHILQNYNVTKYCSCGE